MRFLGNYLFKNRRNASRIDESVLQAFFIHNFCQIFDFFAFHCIFLVISEAALEVRTCFSLGLIVLPRTFLTTSTTRLRVSFSISFFISCFCKLSWVWASAIVCSALFLASIAAWAKIRSASFLDSEIRFWEFLLDSSII